MLCEKKSEHRVKHREKKTEGPLYQRLLKPAGSPCRRCFLTQHNVTTIVLKLAAVGYSATAFPCKASRMKPRQRRVAAGAAQTSPYPDRPLTALRRRPFLPSSLRSGPLYLHPPALCALSYRIPAPMSSSFARCPARRATFYLIVRRAYPPARFSHSDNEQP